jgi:hypothetical protein
MEKIRHLGTYDFTCDSCGCSGSEEIWADGARSGVCSHCGPFYSRFSGEEYTKEVE